MHAHTHTHTHTHTCTHTHTHTHTQMGDVQSVKVLIAFGARVNSKNAFGQTPLDLALMHRYDDVIGVLASVGGESGLKMDVGSQQTLSPRTRSGKKLLILLIISFQP